MSAVRTAIDTKQHQEKMRRPIGIIGYGYVGKIVAKFFEGRYDVKISDPLYKDSVDAQTINTCDLVVIALPTPMDDHGVCDTSIVEEVLGWVDAPLILLRSTVPPVTTDRLQVLTGKHIVFSPEYVGESKYWTPYSFHTDEREMPFFIFGGVEENCQRVIDLYAVVTGPTRQYRTTTAKIAETVKYFENEFFAWKVMWANEFRETCAAIGVPFWEVRDLWALDPRVDPMHTAVFADNRGFGGKCFPKDTMGLYHWANEAGYEKQVLRTIIEKNIELRRGRDDYADSHTLE